MAWKENHGRRIEESQCFPALDLAPAFRPPFYSKGCVSVLQSRRGTTVVDSETSGENQSRPPTLEDLLHLCRELNHAGAKYIVIGGMAIIHLGFIRATEDIDLLINVSPENVHKIRMALMALPDQAVREMTDSDLDHYQVVRVADEIVVDLMKSACGVSYHEADKEISWDIIEDVSIPFAGAALLWKLKQSPRAKDEIDRSFLRILLGK
jgi:hypothetical protein